MEDNSSLEQQLVTSDTATEQPKPDAAIAPEAPEENVPSCGDTEAVPAEAAFTEVAPTEATSTEASTENSLADEQNTQGNIHESVLDFEEDDEDEEPVTGYMSVWGERANALSDSAWKTTQIVLGILLGVICGVCIGLLPSQGFLALNFIVAFLIAKFGPDLLESGLERKMPSVRIVLVITLAVGIVAYLVYILITQGATGFTG